MSVTQNSQSQNQILEIQLKGLYTSPNNLGACPPGSMAIADNMVLTEPSIIKSRRGQQVYGTTLTDIPDRLFTYRETLLNHTIDGTLSYDSDGFGTWVAYSGTFNPPSTALAIHNVEANKNFYFTSATGIQKLSSITGDIILAGAPPALGGTGTTTGTTGFFPPGVNTAYEVVWGYTDDNNNLILGAPSSSIIVSNATIDITATTDGSTAVLTSPSSTTGIMVGMTVTGTGIPDGATVVSIDLITPTITISENTTSANTDEPVTFGFFTNVSLTFNIPSGIDTTWFYQVYRAPFSANLTSSPGVEFAQVLQGNPTSGDITAGIITVTDNTPTDLTGALLYTNPSQFGAAAAQYRPPLAADMCEFLGYTFYANTSENQSLDLTLIGAGNGTAFSYVQITGDVNNSTTVINLSDTTNLRVGMLVIDTYVPANTTIVSINTGASTMILSNATTGGSHTTEPLECEDGVTIAGVTFYGSSNPTLPNQFLVDTNSDPAIAITNTAYNLINTVNTYPGTTIYGYYLSGFSELPGQMLFEAINLGTSTFYATSTNGASFNPVLPTSGTTVASDNSVNPNYLWYSSFSQPEAVPLSNFIPIGSADYPIKRILPLRTSVMIFKDDGIFRLFGTTPSQFQVFLLDSTAYLNAPESAVNFNNQIYYDSSQGVATLSDNSTPVIISIPIDVTLDQISTYENYYSTTFGVGYESDRTYLLALVSENSDTYPTQVFAYNYVTDSWTRWVMDRSCGLVSVQLPSGGGNLLYMGNPDSNTIYQERKSFTSFDYADDQFDVTITDSSGFNVTLSDASAAVVGQTLGQSGIYSVIAAVNLITNVITVSDLNAWSNSDAILYNPIENNIQFNPFDADNMGIVKHFRECVLSFRDAAFEELTVTYSSNFAAYTTSQVVSPVSQFSWGLPPWGNFAWGGALGGMQNIPVYVTPNQQRAHWLNVGLTSEQAFTSLALQGISLTIENVSERFRGAV